MGLKIRKCSWEGLLSTLLMYPFAFFDGPGENRQDKKVNMVMAGGKKGQRMRKGWKEGGRERQRRKMGKRKGGRKEKLQKRKGWRGMEEGTGRKGMKSGGRERDSDEEIERQSEICGCQPLTGLH